MRLSWHFRWSLYVAFTLMFLTGVVWKLADWQKAWTESDEWQAIAAWLLMAHGGGAMVTLLLLGALLPIHVNYAWRGKRNRASGVIMITLNVVLVTTSFGLYYTASEVLRPWISNIHLFVGLSLPAFLLMHISLGRRTPSQSAQESPRWTLFSRLHGPRWRSHPS